MCSHAFFVQFCPGSTPLDREWHILITKAPRARIFHPKTFLDGVWAPYLLETIVATKPARSKQKKGSVTMSVKRGDIYYADLSPVIGSEQGGLRPVLIVQNDIGNRYSPTVIAAAITSRMSKAKLPTHIDIFAGEVGLAKDSVILLEQIRTLDKKRLKEKMGHLDDAVMNHVNTAIAISFGLGTPEEDLAARAMMQQISYTSHTTTTIPAASATTTNLPAAAVSNQPKAEG